MKIMSSKSTEKVGSSGRFGTRYGVVVRNRTRDIMNVRRAKHECPVCHRNNVKRVSSGVWECSKCSAKFTASAYSPLSKKDTAGATIARASQVDTEKNGE